MVQSEVLIQIGRRLYDQRKKMELTQEEMAEVLEISATFYGGIERGRKRISIEKILLAYERLGLDPTYLLTGERRSGKLMEEFFQDCPKEKQPILEQILICLAKLCE